ncbi:hypothetical protein T4A_13385 [Trichinella pseudospiralis]|uniref:Uncharacterized protein n=1 Tax=Trichinella pseudospiralis TaxID=6337 RepID=A0A0V1EB86_TRIPS|nr:hypothetical protein T4A_13385 [Trichinella pseudospiralis]
MKLCKTEFAFFSYTSPSPIPIKLKEGSTYTRITARCQTNNRELVLFKPCISILYHNPAS